jgi:hypothetical protein
MDWTIQPCIENNRIVDAAAGKNAITELPNKEEFPWRLRLLPVKWMV